MTQETTSAEAARRQERLDRAAQLTHDAAATARLMRQELPRTEGNKPAARTALVSSGHAWEAYQELLSLGAAPACKMPDGEPLNLAALTLLESPALRELLAALEKAQEIAERVDAERGHVLPKHIPLQPGESRGTDLAELIGEIAQRVRMEIEGPRGRE